MKTKSNQLIVAIKDNSPEAKPNTCGIFLLSVHRDGPITVKGKSYIIWANLARRVSVSSLNPVLPLLG